jgi:hypothetical protein
MNFHKIQYATMLVFGLALIKGGFSCQATTLGPIGGNSSGTFDHRDEATKPITRIRIWHGSIFDRIQVYYGKKKLGTCNPLDNSFNAEFRVSPNDPIVKVSGVYGNWYGGMHLAKVVFKTRNGKQFGPFGSGDSMESQTPFSLSAPVDEKIRAFFGGCFIHSDDAIFISLLGAETEEIIHREILETRSKKVEKTHLKAHKNKKSKQ